MGQSPEIEWDNTIGGGSTDILYDAKQTHDNGFVLGGYSGSSMYADKSENNIGLGDYWIVKTDSLGNIEWQNTIGGEDDDYLISIDTTDDNGYILGGYSLSNISGDKNEDCLGGNDFWIVKLDSTGNIEWQNTIGGSSDDILQCIKFTGDKGYLLGGYSMSNISGDKNENSLGSYDYWVIKLDSTGNILWQNTIGGNSFDYLHSLVETADEGFIVCGTSSSDLSGDKNEPSIPNDAGIPTLDYWIIKFDAFGNIEWQNTIGGSAADYGYDIIQIGSGEYIVAGSSASEDSGDKTFSGFGNYDFWVLKLTSFGAIQWQQTYGGNLEDGLDRIKLIATDDGLAIAGDSESDISGNKTEPNLGYDDYWILKTDSLGNIQWQKVLGGDLTDRLNTLTLIATSNDGLLLGGKSNSNISGTKSENNIGNGDYWIIKLSGNCIISTFYRDFDNDGYGSPFITLDSCSMPTGYVLNNFDCNDFDPNINPSSIDTCNTIDDNCNGFIDEDAEFFSWYQDVDLDSFGNPSSDTTSCFILSGFVIDSTDCNDLNYFINPLQSESCNLFDDNCNGLIDDSITTFHYFQDYDSDGYGNSLVDSSTCQVEISGYVIDSTDCDDFNSEIFPGAAEIQNGTDDNCNDIIDETLTSIHPTTIDKFRIFPNPNSGTFEIRLNYISSQNATVSIYNQIGELIFANFYTNTNILVVKLPSNFSGFGLVLINTTKQQFSSIINTVQ